MYSISPAERSSTVSRRRPMAALGFVSFLRMAGLFWRAAMGHSFAFWTWQARKSAVCPFLSTMVFSPWPFQPMANRGPPPASIALSSSGMLPADNRRRAPRGIRASSARWRCSPMARLWHPWPPKARSGLGRCAFPRHRRMAQSQLGAGHSSTGRDSASGTFHPVARRGAQRRPAGRLRSGFYRNMGTGFNSHSASGRGSQPSRTGTSYSRPGANRGQKCLRPGTITLATGRPTSGRV